MLPFFELEITRFDLVSKVYLDALGAHDRHRLIRLSLLIQEQTADFAISDVGG